jgi:hypothetical protein
MMTGAGGGCCGESNPYGFSAVHLTDDGRMETTTNVHATYPNECHWSDHNKNLRSYRVDLELDFLW